MTAVKLYPENNKPTVLMAFKTITLKHGQLTFVRIYQGKVSKGSSLVNMRTGKKTRFGRLVRIHADQQEDIAEATAGDIVGVMGVNCASGDTFTSDNLQVALEDIYVPKPAVRLAISAADKKQADTLAAALDRFSKDDPTFHVISDAETGQTLIAGMGQLHLEVYVEKLQTDFECECIIGQPLVAYKEHPTKTVEFTHRLSKQTGGPGTFAEITARLEPVEVDDDFVFESQIKGGAIEPVHVKGVKSGFTEALKNGPLGNFEMVGVKITLLDGEMHEKDSSEYAFQLCAQQALRDVAYKNANVRLWEPIMHLEIESPREFQGAITSQLGRLRGVVTDVDNSETGCVLRAEVPLAETFNYSDSLRSITKGTASFSMELSGYRETVPKVQRRVLL